MDPFAGHVDPGVRMYGCTWQLQDLRGKKDPIYLRLITTQTPFLPVDPVTATRYSMHVPLNFAEIALCGYALLKSDVTRRDHVSVVMDAGSRIVNFIVNFIRDGTVFA